MTVNSPDLYSTKKAPPKLGRQGEARQQRAKCPPACRTAAAIILMLAAFLLAGLAARYAAHYRRLVESSEAQATSVQSTLPPTIRFATVALGGIRGIVADILWIRASALQESGRYFELVQLADWITALEPHFPEVWIFHAWNLAYNVSVLFNSPVDRWRWVRHGISLLRDRAIIFNPREPSLYRELGWLFQHKIGADYDTAHWYYKRALADEMSLLFPNGRPDYERLRKAPHTAEELAGDPRAAALLRRLQDLGMNPMDTALLDPARRSAEVEALLREDPAASTLLGFLRRRHMEQDLKMMPALMEKVESICGPLDWRLPYAHSAYWGYRGSLVATGFEKLACQRMIYQSAAAAFRRGKLYYDPSRDLFILLPDLELFEYALRAFDRAALEAEEPAAVEEAGYYFLRMATVLFYVYSGPQAAERVFKLLRSRSGGRPLPDKLEEFVVEETLRTSPFASRPVKMLDGVLFQAAFWQKLDFPQRADGFQRLGRLLWQHLQQYKLQQGEEPLPSFQELLQQARDKAEKMLAHRS